MGVLTQKHASFVRVNFRFLVNKTCTMLSKVILISDNFMSLY